MAKSTTERPPVQKPLDPGAGFIAEVTDEEHERWLASLDQPTKPDGKAERMLACLGMVDLEWRERAVLATLASFDGPGGCFPAEATIATMLGIYRQRVTEAKESLRRKGRLRWERGHGSGRLSCEYRIAYRQPFQCPAQPVIGELSQRPAQPVMDCPAQPVTNTKEQGASRRVTRRAIDRGGDLCRGRRGDCDAATFTLPGAECLRCGWRKPEEGMT